MEDGVLVWVRDDAEAWKTAAVLTKVRQCLSAHCCVLMCPCRSVVVCLCASVPVSVPVCVCVACSLPSAPFQAPPEALADVPFSVVTSDGRVQELVPGGGSRVMVAPSTLSSFIQLAIQARVKESSSAMAMVRHGLDRVVPLEGLRLFSW